ncbi:hypothetical protein [Arthrobacter sp. S39]|uniref:hypothetical protein n=1 Tax=Arthrobacter sp. S39 TaxID=2509720 RepID=UPI001037EA5E|nr:hypothetical protein [Arthrobacter sp. S39]TAP39090.1 hypothetical protein EYS21_22905 [Arthrobacter sp. S39]
MANAQQGERFPLSPRRITDADWFGLEANPSGTINVPIENPYLEPPAQTSSRLRENDRECQQHTRRHQNSRPKEIRHD